MLLYNPEVVEVRLELKSHALEINQLMLADFYIEFEVANINSFANLLILTLYFYHKFLVQYSICLFLNDI